MGLLGRAEPASDLPQRLGSLHRLASSFRPCPLVVWARQTGAGVLRVQRGDGAIHLLGAQPPAQVSLTWTLSRALLLPRPCGWAQASGSLGFLLCAVPPELWIGFIGMRVLPQQRLINLLVLARAIAAHALLSQLTASETGREGGRETGG